MPSGVCLTDFFNFLINPTRDGGHTFDARVGLTGSGQRERGGKRKRVSGHILYVFCSRPSFRSQL